MAIYYLHIVHSIVAKAINNFQGGADCMKKFCADLKKHATESINYEKKEMLPLTDGKIESYNKKKFCHICKNKFYDVDDRDDNSNNDSDDDSNGENFMSEGFILTLQDLTIVIIIIIIMAMMMITFMKNLMSESFMVMLQDAVM